jgi:VWFA-related protein
MRSVVINVAPVCLLVSAFAAPAAAQSAPPPESGVTIRTTVNEVVLDLVVRDSRGRQVKDLQPSEVEVYEDGVLQQIRSFRLVPGREVHQRRASAGKQRASSAPGTTRTPSHPLRAVSLVCLVFHNNLDVTTLDYSLAAAREFFNYELQPDTYVGVFRLDARLKVLYPFTNNREELIQASRNGFSGRQVDFARASEAVLNANATPASLVAPSAAQASGGEIDTHAVTGALATAGGTTTARGEVAVEGMRQRDQMIAMIQQLGGLPGHKTILLLSPGVVNTQDSYLLQSVLSMANRSSISIYAVDTRGLTEDSNLQAGNQALQHVVALSQQQANPVAGDIGGAGQQVELMRQDDYLHQAVRTSDTQASLRALAEGTGGFLIGNTNDLRKLFQRVVEDVDTHYEVAYRPASDKLDGHFRSIDIKLARADLSAHSRRGYYSVPDLGGSATLAPFEIAALTALNARPQPHAFDLYSGAFRFRSNGTSSQYAIAFEWPAANLSATPQPDQMNHRLHVSVLALVKDRSGQVVAKISQDFPTEVTDERLAALRASTITYTHPIRLPPGRYTVETAVVDREGGQSSTNLFQIDNPEGTGVGLSNVVLVQRIETVTGQRDTSDPFQFRGGRAVPELATTLPPGAHPSVYFVVYPDKSKTEKPRIGVQVLLGGQVIARQTSDLPAPDASGAIPMVIRAVPGPGDYELRITALQGSDSVEQSLKYSIAAK